MGYVVFGGACRMLSHGFRAFCKLSPRTMVGVWYNSVGLLGIEKGRKR